MVLAAGAVNTPVILLGSYNAAHPNGLANGSDQVGRNYMFHTLTAVVSITAAPLDSTFPKTLAVNDFYWGDPKGGYDKPMGHIQALEYMSGQTLEGQISEILPPALVPDVFTNAIAARMLSFLVISEDLPLPDNRVRLAADGRIFIDYTYNNLEGHERLVKKLDDALTGFVDHKHFLSQQQSTELSLLHYCWYVNVVPSVRVVLRALPYFAQVLVPFAGHSFVHTPTSKITADADKDK